MLSVVAGAVYFDEFGGMEAYRVALFSLGLSIVCCGIYILAREDKRKKRSGITFFSSIYVVMVAKRWFFKLRRRQRQRQSGSMSSGSPIDHRIEMPPSPSNTTGLARNNSGIQVTPNWNPNPAGNIQSLPMERLLLDHPSPKSAQAALAPLSLPKMVALPIVDMPEQGAREVHMRNLSSKLPNMPQTPNSANSSSRRRGEQNM